MEPKLPATTGILFLNTASGAGLPAADGEALLEAAAEQGLEVVRLTPDLDVASTVRDALARGRTLFVAAGGDGTVSTVVQALVQHPEACLAVVPTGTYNHFARDLGIPVEWRAALDVARTGRKRIVDTGRVNDRFFINNVSIGLYADLVRRREQKGRDYPRWKSRIYALYGTLRKFSDVRLVIESAHHREVIRTHVFLVSNNSYDLSRIGVEASRTGLGEGRLSVYWLPHLSRSKLFRFVTRYLSGRALETPGLRSFRTATLKVHAAPPLLRAGVDGELVSLTTPLTITIVPQSLEVRVP